KLKFRLFSGGKSISFRMYRDGIGSLVQGWTKNFASGAVRTPFWLFALVFLWITGCTSAPIEIILSVIQGDWLRMSLNMSLYLLWVLELLRIANKLGSFRLSTVIFYPVSLILFFWVFIRSFWKKLLKQPVQWKGREISLRR
ncbi:MAG: hypothetical protein LBI03_10420, partial [Clostridiales bacterium]|nr:hypothetical protein [Clostridiales bacterium]